jgi:[ribulose-bisphosphate carboxylase]-lysine N-methyltransferase
MRSDFILLICDNWKLCQQVMIQYDINKSNADLALDYGFIESKADRNAFTLTLEISESDPFFGDKLDIAESNGLGETAYFDIVFDRPLPPTMLQYLRLVALGSTDAFLLESIFRNSVWGHLELPVSRANEELICQVVRDACKSALSAYHTTIEEVNFCPPFNFWLLITSHMMLSIAFMGYTCIWSRCRKPIVK